MIEFIGRGLRFVMGITKRWLIARWVAIRSCFYVWLDINICLNTEPPIGLDAAQGLSKHFTRTFLKPGRHELPSEHAEAPGIFLICDFAPTELRLHLLTAVCLRLLTPKSQYMALILEQSGRVSAPEFDQTVATGAPRQVSAGTQVRNSSMLISIRHRLASRIVSNPSPS